ncbi:hypothetical protein A2318_00115 [Candidatus Uhrbacteria bacterium RIFOXYB2_FULL_45_11]|uniref:EfeO-type cupredoxin-like domain-containing protein n=1 Tax=Candidatus Uhrbacteria bacterium RIFOXYB2_FULL_45_11 TaxID=1802421 RepID=A0A1F7W0M4_9BACT|nr:MAG: hypothetical protein A2318_00115 [Candidatus Uhrbacteria bacterium RIFOXYB2_FULL_45_11]
MKKIIATLSLLALVGAGCSSNQPQTNSETPVTTTTDQENVSETKKDIPEGMVLVDSSTKTQFPNTNDTIPVTEVALGNEQIRVDMEVKDFTFSPKIINAKAGETIKLTFTKVEGTHTFVIDGITNVKAEIKTGVIFKAPTTPGSYPFYCNIGNHRAMGMEGTLIVK